MPPIIQLENCKVQQKGNEVLSQVNFSLEEGELVYLVGKTGSGKSSLLKTLYAELPLAQGKGQVAGHDLTSIPKSKVPFLRRKLGIIFQDFNLLTDRNVGENLNFVLNATDWTSQVKRKRRIAEVLDAVGLSDKVNAMPYHLSGGEQQRIVIARALLNEPSLLLADEPTGNLDPETSDDILDLLHAVCKQTSAAMVLATHDYRLIDNYPNRVIRIKNGQVIDEASSFI